MEITEVRVKLMDDPHERLLAFCSITFDGCFVIRDLKLIHGKVGPFTAMPSRKLTDRCPKCHMKNHLRAAYCSQCGSRLRDDRAIKDDDGRAKLYADIAHPITSPCRESIQAAVNVAYERELLLARQPGYVCTYDDFGEERFADLEEAEFAAELVPRPDLGREEFRRGEGRFHRIDRAEPLGGAHDVPAREPERVGRRDDEFGSGLV